MIIRVDWGYWGYQGKLGLLGLIVVVKGFKVSRFIREMIVNWVIIYN